MWPFKSKKPEYISQIQHITAIQALTKLWNWFALTLFLAVVSTSVAMFFSFVAWTLFPMAVACFVLFKIQRRISKHQNVVNQYIAQEHLKEVTKQAQLSEDF